MAAKSLVIYDTEFTTWEGAITRNWSGPGEFREIVQIGAMRIDAATLTVQDTFDIFIKPVKNPVLSDYFVRLTGITQDAVDSNGLAFAEALSRFRSFIGGWPAVAYGHDDMVMRENQELHNLPQDFFSQNIGPWFMEHGAAYGVKKGVNSGALARTVGAHLDSDVAEHNALEDVRSIIAAYGFLRAKGAPEFKE